MEQESAGYQKAQEYASRIKNGEDQDLVLKGLPPAFVKGINAELEAEQASNNKNEHQEVNQTLVPPQYEGMSADAVDFIWTVPEYVDPQKTQEEKARKQRAVDFLREKEAQAVQGEKSKLKDEVALAKARKALGIEVESQGAEEAEQKLEKLEISENIQSSVKGIIEYVSQGRPQPVLDLYQGYIENIDNLESKRQLISALFTDIYNKYRLADYPKSPEEEKIWDEAIENSKVNVRESNNWQYRGITGPETETRGSLNVAVNPEVINALDEMIINGELKGNYKFGEPGTTASPSARHDAITIYFQEKPSREVLEKISAIAQPFVRGNNLLGDKITDGFYMSEVGSISNSHINDLVANSANIDPSFSEAVRFYTTPRTGTTLKMSEAQYYTIRDVARAFGYEIGYDKVNGFDFKVAA